jgi:uncharacterized protein
MLEAMPLIDQIREDLKGAMKARDRHRTDALRLLISELEKATKDGGDDELTVLRRERKRRREAEVAYADANRPDLADNEAREVTIIETYLPPELSEEELKQLVATAIAQTGAQTPRDSGKAIRQVIESAGGRADGKRVAQLVTEALK